MTSACKSGYSPPVKVSRGSTQIESSEAQLEEAQEQRSRKVAGVHHKDGDDGDDGEMPRAQGLFLPGRRGDLPDHQKPQGDGQDVHGREGGQPQHPAWLAALRPDEVGHNAEEELEDGGGGINDERAQP